LTACKKVGEITNFANLFPDSVEDLRWYRSCQHLNATTN
jgi:hypothetical protein